MVCVCVCFVRCAKCGWFYSSGSIYGVCALCVVPNVVGFTAVAVAVYMVCEPCALCQMWLVLQQ